jgi:hypothetical protein
MNREELKAQHKKLGETQPFTKNEQKSFDKKDQSMIRNIQILNGISKKDAINVLKAYKSTPKATLRRLARAYRKRLNKYSSPQKPSVEGELKAPKPIKGKKGVSHQKKPEKRTSDVLKTNRQKTRDYLNNPQNKNEKTYSRIEKASKKYIDASDSELRHGVNSKWSQNYRVKQELNAKYEGRIIK